MVDVGRRPDDGQGTATARWRRRTGGPDSDRCRTPRPVGELSYTEASRELDEIVAFFEQREVDVDQLVARLERATAIVDELDRRLRRTRAQVEELVPRLAAAAGPGPTSELDEEAEDGRRARGGRRRLADGARRGGQEAEPGEARRACSDGRHRPWRPADGRLYFRQLLSGRDFARGDPVARQMVNFVYAVGDRETGEALLVDPAYAVGDLLDVLAADGMRCVGVLGTHYHPDHLGGTMAGLVHRGGGRPARAGPGAGPRPARRGALGRAGHRGDGRPPGGPRQRRRGEGGRRRGRAGPHPRATRRAASASWSTGGWCRATPCSSRAAAGPTCPGSDPEAMYESLTTRLARVPDDAVVFPGHLYSAEPSASMGETRRHQLRLPPPLGRRVAGHVRR